MSRPVQPEKQPEKRAGFSIGDLRILGVVALIAVIVGVVALWPRGDGDGDDDDAPDQAATSQAASEQATSEQPSTSPASTSPASTAASAGRASDEEWCADFRILAADQAEYVGGGGSSDQLVQEASDLAVLGLPASMPPLAVGGWWALLDGIFESVGATPPPGTFLDDPPADQGQYEAEEAFTEYTTDYCPA